jgi:hypothetical protein
VREETDRLRTVRLVRFVLFSEGDLLAHERALAGALSEA